MTKALPDPEVFDADTTRLNELQAEPDIQTVKYQASTKVAKAQLVPSAIGPVQVGSLEWGVEEMRRVQREAHAHLPALRVQNESHYKPKHFKLQRKFGRTMPKGWVPPKPAVRPEDVEYIELFEGVFGTDIDWMGEAVAVPAGGPTPDELRQYHWAVYRTRKALRLRYPEAFLDLEQEPAVLSRFEPKPQERRYRPTGKTCLKCKDKECWMHYDEQKGLWLCFVCGSEVIDVEVPK